MLTTLLSAAESMARERDAREGIRGTLLAPFTCVLFSDATVIANLLHAVVATGLRAKVQPRFCIVPTHNNDRLHTAVASYDQQYKRLFGDEDWLYLVR